MRGRRSSGRIHAALLLTRSPLPPSVAPRLVATLPRTRVAAPTSGLGVDVLHRLVPPASTIDAVGSSDVAPISVAPGVKPSTIEAAGAGDVALRSVARGAEPWRGRAYRASCAARQARIRAGSGSAARTEREGRTDADRVRLLSAMSPATAAGSRKGHKTKGPLERVERSLGFVMLRDCSRETS